MDSKVMTADYVSKYIKLLSKLQNNQSALAPLRVSILCCSVFNTINVGIDQYLFTGKCFNILHNHDSWTPNHVLGCYNPEASYEIFNIKKLLIYSQRNQNSQPDENKSINIENCCQHCLTPWKHGNFVLKTFPKRENKNDKLQKRHSTASFNMVIKCLVCLNMINSEYEKNKTLNQKPTEKSTENLMKSSTQNKNIEKTSKTEEKVETMVKSKPKKKKRNLYAGLNPLIFKNLNKNTSKSKLMIMSTNKNV